MPDRSYSPKVVLALIEKNGKFLLIRRRVRLGKLEWAFPGGVTHQGETDEETVVRETNEEIGLDVEVNEKLLERKHPNTFVQIAYFHCTPKNNKEPKIGEPDEISEIEWVDVNDVLNKFTSDVDPKIEAFIKSFSSQKSI